MGPRRLLQSFSISCSHSKSCNATSIMKRRAVIHVSTASVAASVSSVVAEAAMASVLLSYVVDAFAPIPTLHVPAAVPVGPVSRINTVPNGLSSPLWARERRRSASYDLEYDDDVDDLEDFDDFDFDDDDEDIDEEFGRRQLRRSPRSSGKEGGDVVDAVLSKWNDLDGELLWDDDYGDDMSEERNKKGVSPSSDDEVVTRGRREVSASGTSSSSSTATTTSENNKNSKRRYGEYVTYFDDDYYDEDEYTWEWEETVSGSASVYLPPPPLDQSTPPTLPKTILHFIGGTIFGSYPTKFYSDLLTSIAKGTNSVVVATNIPVTLDRNPLNHLAMSNRIVRSFREAYFDILSNEYADSGTLESVPIVGIGHSLGSRLHVIINTDERLSKGALPRAGNILMGFNNYSAMQSVPGVKSLRKGVRKTEKDRYARKKSDRIRDRRRRERYYNDADDDEYLDEMDEFFELAGESLQRRFGQMKLALTPSDMKEEKLEFQPSPDELWGALSAGIYGKEVAKSLIVQFERDGIDQGARLARCLLSELGDDNVRSSRSLAGTELDALPERENDQKVDVKFARLDGVHVTPTSPYSDWLGLTNAISALGSSDLYLKEMVGERRRSTKSKEGRRKDKQEMEDLVQTITRFLRDL